MHEAFFFLQVYNTQDNKVDFQQKNSYLIQYCQATIYHKAFKMKLKQQLLSKNACSIYDHMYQHPPPPTPIKSLNFRPRAGEHEFYNLTSRHYESNNNA